MPPCCLVIVWLQQAAMASTFSSSSCTLSNVSASCFFTLPPSVLTVITLMLL